LGEVEGGGMATRDNAAPVIIKRKKITRGGGHHGGAWKVAYADFVTAMMAFFMLMWLLNATTEKQRKGIADYFSPTIPINRVSGGGEGVFGGDSVFAEEQIAQTGTGATAQRSSVENQALGQTGTSTENADAPETNFDSIQKEIEEALLGLGGESILEPDIARHIITRITDEGLIVEFFDLENEPLFIGQTSEPKDVTLEIAAMLTRIFSLVDNEVAINGHIHSYPEVLKNNPVWDLSTARAQAFRGLMETAGFNRFRIQRVSGFADRKLAVKNPMAARNNRLEVILLREGR
jgi:chemotaxis protein MotB